MENKRSPCPVDHSGFTSLATKRQKSTKDRKDQIGERIVALQQLVSPYGKTDTASVLWRQWNTYDSFTNKLSEYATRNCSDCWIKHKVLSAPYLQNTPTNNLQAESHYCLRNRGLCLVPISCTVGVACSSNGADIWAPIKTTSPKFDKVISQIN
ncbi:Detected protein of confused Function [Hibiscus syriacus]|uniref:Detected protein of confused Function n=1 Tax=Hibiscus syriacus TaxID=106335 RepID=A0A6A3C3W4_HIBSY|nr:Detected protein of confused Function [Hibiscus syriacus]